MSTEASARGRERIGGVMTDEIRMDVDDIKFVSPRYMIELREQIAELKRQLAEPRRKAFEEAAEMAEKMTPLSGMGVQTGRHIAKALREAGKRGLEG